MKPLRNSFAVLLMLCCVSRASDLDTLATVKPGTTSHRASSYDRSGANADNIVSFAPKANHVLFDTAGAGRINHIWLTVSPFPGHPTFLRDLVVRMTWDNAPIPAVEVPLGDFFALGHAKRYTLQSGPVAVGSNDRSLNCYWPMPFYKHAKIEIYNNGSRSIRRIYYHVNYELGPQPENQGLFHALFRYERGLKTQAREGNTTGKDNYVILDTEGQGQYVGCALFVDAEPGGWWGEGDDMTFIDHSEKPVIFGTGTEEYFGNAWGFDTPFCYPYYGCPLLEKRPDGGSLTAVYRWHIPDPIRFQKHIRVTLEHTYPDQSANDYSSVAYWYQLQSIMKREPLPYAEANHPKQHPQAERPAASLDLDGSELEALLLSRGVAARAITASYFHGYVNGGWLRVENVISPLEIPIAVPEDGDYRVRLKPVSHVLEQPMRIGFKGGQMQTFERRIGDESQVPWPEGRVPYLDLGTASSQGKTLTVVIEGGPTVGIDHIRIKKGNGPVTAPAKPGAGPKDENGVNRAPGQTAGSSTGPILARAWCRSSVSVAGSTSGQRFP
jgi:hypothetical protein